MIITDISLLRRKSIPITAEEAVDLNLAYRIKEELPSAWTKGYGLAAVQIGVPVQYARYTIGGKDKSLINPRIVRGVRAYITKEGCLSLPNQWYSVSRFMGIFYTAEGGHDGRIVKGLSDASVVYYAEGTEAQIIQHEIDHMHGILVCDRQVRSAPKIGRNEPCPLCAKEGIKIKWKKCAKHNKLQ